MQQENGSVVNALVACLGKFGKYSPKNLSCVGEGGFGKVYLIEQKNTKLAIKVIIKSQLSDKSKARTTVEHNILRCVAGNSFFVHCRDYYDFETAYYFVMDYCQGGDLHKRLTVVGTFNEDSARFYLGEIAVALGLLHQAGYIHRDLKLENVLINADGHIVLADFGLAKLISNSDDMDDCGTTLYMAPEVIDKRNYDEAIDYWALGIMAYEMLIGLHPFHSDIERSNSKELKERIKSDPLRFPVPNNLSPCAMNLISKLLSKDPMMRPVVCFDYNERFSSYNLRADPFFLETDWESFERRELQPPFVPP